MTTIDPTSGVPDTEPACTDSLSVRDAGSAGMADRPVVLVTGGARRIGRALALLFADRGFDVALHCRRSRDTAAATVAAVQARGAGAQVFVADLADSAACEGLAATVVRDMGRVDVLVHNASVYEASPLASASPAEIGRAADRHHAIHVRAPLVLSAALADALRVGGQGAIVALTDAVGVRAEHAPYSASKAALTTAMLCLALELAPHVTVNVVAPGIILPADGESPARFEGLVARIPAGRPGTPEEVAAAVLFAATGPRFMTGQVIAVDGALGRSAWPRS